LKAKYFYYFVLTKVLFSQDIAYKNFQKYVQSPNGTIFNINYHQDYFNKKSESSGRLYSNKTMYVYDNNIQYIKYQDGFITTINKINKQIIYDAVNEKDVTIFDVLIGKDHNVQIDDSIVEKSAIRIPFSIDEWGIKGSIWTNHINGSPKRITFSQGQDLKVEINITSMEFDREFTLPSYDTSDFEVINLIE